MKLSKIAKQVILEQKTAVDLDYVLDNLSYTSADSLWEIKASSRIAATDNYAWIQGIPIYKNKFELRDHLYSDLKLSPSYDTWTAEQKRNGIPPQTLLAPKDDPIVVNVDTLMTSAKIIAENSLLKSLGKKNRQFTAPDYDPSELDNIDDEDDLPGFTGPGGTPFKVPTPGSIDTAEKAIDFLQKYWAAFFGKPTPFEYIRPYLGTNGINNVLLRGKDIVWFYNGKTKKKMEWTDIKGVVTPGDPDNNAWKKTFWDKSVYVGDANIQWLQSIPVAKITKDKIKNATGSAGRVDRLDVIMVNLCKSARIGTDEALFNKTALEIKNTREFNQIDKMLKLVSYSYSTTSMGDYDFFLFRAPKVTHMTWDNFEGMFGYDIARDINPYFISWDGPSMDAMKETGAVSDRLLKYTSVNDWKDKGFRGLLEAEFKAGWGRDKSLKHFLDVGICGWDGKRSVIWPDGKKTLCDRLHEDLPPKGMKGIGYKNPGTDDGLDFKSSKWKDPKYNFDSIGTDADAAKKKKEAEDQAAIDAEMAKKPGTTGATGGSSN